MRQRSTASRCLVSLLTALGGFTISTAHAAADPQYTDGSAQSIIDQLEAYGYNVVINWLTGYDTKPLSVCRVSRINNPDSSDAAPGTFTTVYVDVSCPNHEYG